MQHEWGKGWDLEICKPFCLLHLPIIRGVASPPESWGGGSKD